MRSQFARRNTGRERDVKDREWRPAQPAVRCADQLRPCHLCGLSAVKIQLCVLGVPYFGR
jgi:hypothetical protein